MAIRSTKIAHFIGWLAFGLAGVVAPASAHHALGGRLPSNFWEGLLSGIAHPIIGLDHLAFVIAIGLLSVGQKRGYLLPLCFLLMALLGTGLHLQRFDLPAAEIVISLSVIALGAILAWGKQLSFPVVAGLAAIAGLFHGYAYGESIVGTGMMPLVAYLIGFTLIQAVISLLAFWVGSKLSQSSPQVVPVPIRYFGYATCAIGFLFLTASVKL